MSEVVDWSFINNNRELIADMVSNWLGIYAKEYELTTVMNDRLRTFIIDKSIIYSTVIMSDEDDISNFGECFTSEAINAIPAFVLPATFRKKLENEINEVIQEALETQKEKLFVIKPNDHLGRIDLLYKSVIYQVKLLYKQYMHNVLQKEELTIGSSYPSFKKIVELYYRDIVNRAIQFSLCYEANNRDYEMCRKILVESALNEKGFHYRLEKHVDIDMKKKIEKFLKNFESKKIDFEIFNIDKAIKILLATISKAKKIDENLKNRLVKIVEDFDEIDDASKVLFVKTIEKAEYSVIGAKESLVKKIKVLNKDEFQEALLNTIGEAEKAIEMIFSSDAYEDCQQCSQLHQEYKNLIENSKERVTNPAKLKNFKIALKKAKLNYVLKYKDQYIYPFVYDLIVITFSVSIKRELYDSNITKTNSLAKSINEKKYKYIDKDSDENYLFEDLLQLIEILPDEFKNVDTTLLIIKHYSEILKVEYTDISTVLRQLRFEVPDDAKAVYAFPKHLKNINLSIDDDHFRALSLDII